MGYLSALNTNLQILCKKDAAMTAPKVSVIIPAYNQADFLKEAIKSVLDQTYNNFEVIVVNDASPDHTEQVIQQFDDPRLKHLVHQKNLGLPAARNTGMRAAEGEIIALLDSDDLFHPEKLAAHVDFLNKNPDIGSSYNARFELHHSATTIRDIWRPPLTVTLSDLVQGFPFSPSDMVLRKDWAFKVGLFGEKFVCGGEDLDFPCRLALAGCKFAGVDRVLNYRRYHSGRFRTNLTCRKDDVDRALETTFSDPNCPKTVLAKKDLAYVHHYLVLVFHGLVQDDPELISIAQDILRRAIKLDPSLLSGNPCTLIQFFLANSIWDENLCHQELLQTLFAHLPSEISYLTEQLTWAVKQGYLRRGIGNLLWGQTEKGATCLIKAKELGAQFDEIYLREITDQLISYEMEFGIEATKKAMATLSQYITKVGSRADVRWLKGCYFINQAFKNYKTNQFSKVPANIIKSVSNNPAYLTNRGIFSIFTRSLVHMMHKPTNLI